jgi:transcriptional pleiotropic regulator of transition state genes
MKSTGVVRKLDMLGRIVFPVEIRRTLGIAEGDPMEVFVEGDLIILKKYEPACTFCGEAKDVIDFKGKKVCVNCLDEMTGVGGK